MEGWTDKWKNERINGWRKDGWMEGNGWRNGWMVGWKEMDGEMDGWLDGQTVKQNIPSSMPVMIEAKLSSNRIMSAACLLTSEPLIPMAIPVNNNNTK